MTDTLTALRVQIEAKRDHWRTEAHWLTYSTFPERRGYFHAMREVLDLIDALSPPQPPADAPAAQTCSACRGRGFTDSAGAVSVVGYETCEKCGGSGVEPPADAPPAPDVKEPDAMTVASDDRIVRAEHLRQFVREHAVKPDREQYLVECCDVLMASPAPEPGATPEAGTALAVTGDTSDGYHTFDELYAYRKAFNALLFNEWAAQGRYDVHKSWRHSDGEPCFGGGWFIVVAQTPEGQISNHYKAEDWSLFNVPERERGAEYDGHTPQDALDRMLRLAALCQAQAEET